MSLVIATVVATVLAVIGIPYRTYEAWFGWNRRIAPLGILIYFVAAGLGGGLLGWGSGRWSGALSTNDLLVQGLAYGLVGAALTRATLRLKPQTSRGKGSVIEQSVSALGLLLKWLTDFLDDVAQRGAHKWFGRLVDEDLLYQSQTIKANILASDISDKLRKELLKNFVEAAEKFASGNPALRDEGHAQLVMYSAIYVTDEHMPKSLFSGDRTRMKS